jgi:SPP1 gp7 family putative phage head morphogenesis protein
MLADVNAIDRNAWDAHTKEMGQAIGDEIRNAPVGDTLRALQAEQVTLIKSLPLEAAQRVHTMTLKGIEDGTRYADIAAEIRRTGDVTESRATLIARTEVARAASQLTQARATHAGSDGYVWRTSHDGDVRSSHREMEGKFVRWDSPPLLSDGTRTHAGQIFNCRCWPEPVLPDLKD